MIEVVDDTDERIVARYKNEKPWGMESMVQLYGCDKDIISDELSVFDFIIKLVDFIDMKRYGDPIIERFGEGDLYGISATQLIHTSCITMHFSEKDGRVFLNIFSCKQFKPEETARFALCFFKGDKHEVKTMFRD